MNMFYSVASVMRPFLIVLLFSLSVLAVSCGGGGPVIPDDSGYPRNFHVNDVLNSPKIHSEIGAALRTVFKNVDLNEMFGQDVIDTYFTEIDKIIEKGFARNVSSAMSVEPRTSAHFEVCQEFQGAFEMNDCKCEGNYTICPSETEDKKITKMHFHSDLKGTGGDKADKTLRMILGIESLTDKCPTLNGKVEGESLVYLLVNVSDGKSAHHLEVNCQFDFDVTLNDDAEVENVECNLNVSAEGYEPDYPSTGYNGVSHKVTDDFNFAEKSFIENMIVSLNPQGPCPNPKGVGVALGICFLAADTTAEDARKYWQKNGTCVEIILDPEALQISSGETKPFDAKVVHIKENAPIAAKLTAYTECGESITPPAAQYSPDSPVTFNYTAPSDGKEGCYTIRASSKCGKDQMDKTVLYKAYVLLDSTLTFELDGVRKSGHGRAEIPIRYMEGLGCQGGFATPEYLNFEFYAPSDCTFETTSKTCSDITIVNYAFNQDQPSATRIEILPFYSYEAVMAHCPEGSVPGPPINSFFSSNFNIAHLDEFVSVEKHGMAFVFTDWTENAEPGIPLKKIYDRVVDLQSYQVTEYTIIEVHMATN